MQELSLAHQNFKVAEDILFRQVENEAVLLHVADGTYYSLNETSVLFWEALRDRQPLETAVDRVLTEYEVDRAQVVEDLEVFLRELLEYELIAPAA